MPKSKYKFDPERLSYEVIVLTPGQKIVKFLKQLAAISIIAAIFLLALSIFFDTPGELQQKRENKQLRSQYELLNKKLQRMELTMDQIKERDDHIYRLIFGAEPIPESYREAGFGGVNRYKELEGFDESQLVIETSKKIDMLLKQLDVQWKSYEEVVALAEEKEVFWASIPAISPLADKDLTRFASGYGYRIHPIYRTKKMHTGIDLTAPTGTEVYATGNGEVAVAGYTPGGYGKRIIVDHGFGFKTVYAHLNSILVKEGQKIKRGELIGTVGSTGRSTAPHLHYEVRKNNQTENPVNYYSNDLTPEQYEEVLSVSSRMNMSFD
ncbi:MAG TPA: peptidase M23 [Marinilabiliales bacterium]|jgi:murein DD-endopeptidase MepM/ murein hydrolase activator NlpD|nr:MAG: peptidase M23 [Bacteroidetes bacterium GWA2_40_14]OFX57358.1 MAG: peptidase M23 [Bacteroidetes bacterium GWC2_40_13]OFX76191.1 MAG: peptidase M23 [Bacteroidetes bacterium GWD2_40_43]OFX95360.1 MAG: peptidase M23 [Bacteroidetes bacterium GWE2_40_63]OFY19023.1 MAG: peptidase M23 [Bacteroidetes bacterium GWF2_40_13]OFZ23995.1 MAG: peptidase M23 [Bacteroidetes bacterium RIFOXYC2_FULL_40_12]HAN00146.1 peptidase M23 [Marinilabiliales bacterium]